MDRLEQTKAHGAPPLKPLNLIVITDGQPDDPDTLAYALASFAERLDQGRFPLTQLGVQFVQIGNDAEATRSLIALDDELKGTHGVKRDIVDTTPYQGRITGDFVVKVRIPSRLVFAGRSREDAGPARRHQPAHRPRLIALSPSDAACCLFCNRVESNEKLCKHESRTSSSSQRGRLRSHFEPIIDLLLDLCLLLGLNELTIASDKGAKMSSSLVKTKLKAAREAIGAKEWSKAEKAAREVIELDGANYNAFVPHAPRTC